MFDAVASIGYCPPPWIGRRFDPADLQASSHGRGFSLRALEAERIFGMMLSTSNKCG
jgi:hypothetical protein